MSSTTRPSKPEASKIIRDLVDKVVLRPVADGSGLDAELHGDLATILAFCDGDRPKSRLPGSREAGSQVSVVAGARYQRFRTPVSAFVPIGE